MSTRIKPSNITTTFKNLAKDGRIGVKDVEKLVAKALDGKGITANEGNELKHLAELHADRFTTKGAEAFDNFLTHLSENWDSEKEVYLPGFDPAKTKKLLKEDPRIAIYTGKSGSTADIPEGYAFVEGQLDAQAGKYPDLVGSPDADMPNHEYAGIMGQVRAAQGGER